MNTFAGPIRRRLLGLAVEETSFARRGFHGAGESTRLRLEGVGAAFLSGYNASLQFGITRNLTAHLNQMDRELAGFAFEGAAMGLALMDSLSPWRSARVCDFLRGPGNQHAYMVHVGVGWVWARLPSRRRTMAAMLDPLLVWLAYDGWGFHEGFFHWQKYLAGAPAPRQVSGYARRAFDQGLGRSLWFVNGANPELISNAIGGLAVQRHADLWSGVGLAAAYAGGVSDSALAALRDNAGRHQPCLAQGGAFAAKARQRAGNLTEYTTLATKALCDLSAAEAAYLCDQTLENLPANGEQPAYEIWRRRIQDFFKGEQVPQLARVRVQ